MRLYPAIALLLTACGTTSVTVDELTFQAIDVTLSQYDDGLAQFDLTFNVTDDCVHVDNLDDSTFAGRAGTGEAGGARRDEFFNRSCVNTGSIVFNDMNDVDDETLQLVIPGESSDVTVQYTGTPFAARTVSWDITPAVGQTVSGTWDVSGDRPTGDGQLQFEESPGGSVVNLFQSDGDFSFDGTTLVVNVPSTADLSLGVFARNLFQIDVVDCPAFDCAVTTEVELSFE